MKTEKTATTDPAVAARRILACLDLTSLNTTDTPGDIAALVGRAHGAAERFGAYPAAVCVYPRLVAAAVAHLGAAPCQVAAVANFPLGTSTFNEVVAEIDLAMDNGAHEIDVVFPFRRFLAGDPHGAVAFTARVIEWCHDREAPATTKVIMETGVLGRRSFIHQAATDLISVGADFLKTSTGKLEPGATPQAAAVLLEAAAHARDDDDRLVGVKVSGGISTVDVAQQYLALADEYLMPVAADSSSLRFGASGLLGDISRVLSEA